MAGHTHFTRHGRSGLSLGLTVDTPGLASVRGPDTNEKHAREELHMRLKTTVSMGVLLLALAGGPVGAVVGAGVGAGGGVVANKIRKHHSIKKRQHTEQPY